MYNQSAYDLGTQRSVIRELAEYGRQRAEVVGPENVFDYSIGNPSVPVPEQVHQAIRDILSDTDPLAIHSYTSAAGDPEARRAIAEDLNRRFDAGADGDDLFLCCGSSTELAAVFHALAVPGAEILAIAPYFPEYKPFAEAAGLTFRVVPADLPHFRIDLAALETMLTPATQAVILNSPNNPTGVVYPLETLSALAALLTEKSAAYGHPIYIVADEPYRELAYGCSVPFIPNIYPNTVVCYSYSKSLSLPGERLGYIYVPKQCADGAALYAAIAGAARILGHICAPSLWQKVIARCTSLGPELDAYDENRKTLYENLTAWGYELPRPDGAFYLFIKAPGGDAMAFVEKAKQKDLLLVPGDGFGCPGYFRVCYCVPLEKIRRSLPLVNALIEEN